MTVTQKKLISILLTGLLFSTVIYFEGDGFEIHRLFIGLIGIFEGVLFAWGLNRFDKVSSMNNWETSKITIRKILLCLGLIAIMVTIDRLIGYATTYYNKDYKMIWTFVFPSSILGSYLFRVLDFWSYENEKKDNVGRT